MEFEQIVPRGQLLSLRRSGEKQHMSGRMLMLMLLLWPHFCVLRRQQAVYPVTGSSSSHLLLLLHPNLILDASHEPRLAIIGSTVSSPHDECGI